MSRRKIFIANWKLHHDRKSAEIFFHQIRSSKDVFLSLDVAIAPVAPMLDFVGQLALISNISLAAQNVFYKSAGAFTGEWSAEQIAELGVKYCIVGHSERRKLFFETNDDVEKKIAACLSANIVPVVCVGESEQERKNNQTKNIIKEQMQAVLSLKTMPNLIVAYEPIWAIGTNKVPLLEEIEEIHRLIRELLRLSSGEANAERARVIYGGSVNAENIKEISLLSDVDGVLVGGASLQAASFLSMVKTLSDV